MEIQFKNAFRFNLNSYQVESINITEHDEETLEENECITSKESVLIVS